MCREIYNGGMSKNDKKECPYKKKCLADDKTDCTTIGSVYEIICNKCGDENECEREGPYKLPDSDNTENQIDETYRLQTNGTYETGFEGEIESRTENEMYGLQTNVTTINECGQIER